MNETDELTVLQLQLQQVSNPSAAFALFEAQSATFYDHILFTVLRFDHHAQVMTRLYSNREGVSPTGGTKPMPEGMWADRVIWSGVPYVGRNRDDLKVVFFDYIALWEAGCGSVMNIPVRRNSVTVGSFNILGLEGQYREDDAVRFSEIAQLSGSFF